MARARPRQVNDYVREVTGCEATAKDFRTWHATVLAAAALAETTEPGESAASRKRAVAGAMREVGEYLGNTPAIARNSYVDPTVIDAYEEGRTIRAATRRKQGTPDLRQAALERATLRLLRQSGEFGRMEITVVEGDITQQEVDAVVNAANRAMRGGEGSTVRSTAQEGRPCSRTAGSVSRAVWRQGQAGWTTAGNMAAGWVIHVVGPNHNPGETDRSLLTSCYSNALKVADELGARTVAFPLVSAGIYGWPREDAIAAAIETLRSSETQVEEARIVAFGQRAYDEIRAGLD